MVGRTFVVPLFNIDNSKNIELENGLRKSAQAKIPSDPNVWLQMRENYEGIILEDHDFSEKHEVEFMLWQLHYKRIEEFRAHINVAKSTGSAVPQGGRSPARSDRIKKIRSAFKSFLSESTGFYHDLILKIQAQYGLPLGYFSEGPDTQIFLSKDDKRSADMKKGLLSCHQCLIYLGDLARYKGIYGDGDSVSREFAAASSYYMQAASLCPSSGNPHHQLAILASYSSDDLVTIYRYFRSLAVEAPFSTARDNLIIAFEKNRQRVAQLPTVKAASTNALPTPSTGRGRDRGDTRILAKDSSTDSPVKLSDLSTTDIFKAFSTLFVRLQGILFTRTSLETFEEVFAAVISHLHELLSSGPKEAHSFGVDAAENCQFIVRVVSILIFTVHNVNRDSESRSYAEILQRSVLLQNAFTASFELVSHFLKRCIELGDVASSFLLPGIMVFIEWLACHPDIAMGTEEKQSASRSVFWDHFVAFMNALLSSGHGYVETNLDETCFSDMSHYDEAETGNRLALWEDFELRGFLPLKQAHLILDFSRKYTVGGEGSNKERNARIHRIFAAGRALMNMVRIDQHGMYYDRHLKRFVLSIEPPVYVDDMHASLRDDPKANVLGGSQSSLVDYGTTCKLIRHMDGEDEEEEIVFKPTTADKYPDNVGSMSSYGIAQPVHVSSIGDWQTSGFYDTHLLNGLNASTHLETSIGGVAPSLQPNLNFDTTKWLMEKEAILSDGLNNLKLGNGFTFQGGSSSCQLTKLESPAGFSTSSLFSGQGKVTDSIVPSPLDSVVLPRGVTNGFPVRPSEALPTVPKKNPVSRPPRHFGPPPGFNYAFPKLQDISLPSSSTKEQHSHIDDYGWLDGYDPTKELIETSVAHASVMHPYTSADSGSAFGGIRGFPFPGKQFPPVQNDVINDKSWQNFQIFEHLLPYAEQNLPQTSLKPALPPERNQAQSQWSSRYFV
ncbi:hypothetical protein HPP92_002588 [Vanilla planifolia]|uniref:Protein SMG7 n=1 Tax=Vanilla planifolia TaxID=51239 RepID=A0A835SA20_VANPL|nr:hypothetical protein HPP92_002588 [Vanilla planifolia]